MSQIFCPRCGQLVHLAALCFRCNAPLPYIKPPDSGKGLKGWWQRQTSTQQILFGVLGFVVLLLLIVVAMNPEKARKAYTHEDEVRSLPSATKSNPASTSDRDTTSRIGDRVERGGIALTLLKVNRQKSLNRFETAEKGNTYLIAEVLIENISRDSAPYNPLYFNVKDWDGIEYRSSIMTENGALQSGEIFKGDKVRGEVAFKIKESAAGLVMSYEPMVIFGGYEPIKFRMY